MSHSARMSFMMYFHKLLADMPSMQPLQLRAALKQGPEGCCQDKSAFAQALSDKTLLESMMQVAASEPLPGSILAASQEATAATVERLQAPGRTLVLMLQQIVASSVADASDTLNDQNSRHKKQTQVNLAESDIQSTASAYSALHVQLIENHGKQRLTPNDQSVLWQSQRRLALLQVVLLVMRLMTLLQPPKVECTVCVKVAMGLASIAAENMAEIGHLTETLTTKKSDKPTAADASEHITQAHDAASSLSALLLRV